jgi:hypothetical protein
MGGYAMKSDCGGHDNVHHDNLYAYVNKAMQFSFYENNNDVLDGHANKFFDNRVVMEADDVGDPICHGTGMSVMHNNQYFTGSGKLQECKMPLAQWQSQGHDLNSTAAPHPTSAQVMGWATDMLR